jgi:hypothetical protein
MLAQTPVVGTVDGKEGKTMMRRGLALGRRLAAFGAAGVLVFSLAGDRGRAASVPAAVYGQDPLEVLELKVRPNVIVVLDSSGSMRWTVKEQSEPNSGDHPRSKMYQAKQVLKQLVQQNQDKVSFQFGTYTQFGINMYYTAPGADRFSYVVSGQAAPFMNTSSTELKVRGAKGDTLGRGLQSWQIIYDEWSTLYFSESGGVTCTATLPGPFPKFYARGGSGTSPATSTAPQENLAYDLQYAMNNASCSGGSRANTYAVSYSTNNGTFTFAATGPATRTVTFNLLPNSTPKNISKALGGLPTSTGTAGSTGGTGPVTLNVTRLARRSASGYRVYVATNPGAPVGTACSISGSKFASGTPTTADGNWSVATAYSTTNGYFVLNNPSGSSNLDASPIGTVTCQLTTAPVTAVNLTTPTAYTLLYRTTGTGNYANDIQTYWTFTENIGGTDVNFYQLRAGRVWNGEVLRVTPTGETCGMDFATAATKTNPPSLTVVAADANCVTQTNTATFAFGGGMFSGNTVSCKGFRSKTDLIPCDLQSPPAATQAFNIGPYIDNELPFSAAGDPLDWDNDGYADYADRLDGSWEAGRMTSTGWASGVKVAPSAKADGSTPIAHSLIDIKGALNAADTNCVLNAPPAAGSFDLNSGTATLGACPARGFTNLWNTGLSTGPWASIPSAQRAIKNHLNPKEKTIVLFVTDGEDTCNSSQRSGTVSMTDNSRRAAYYAQLLYTPLVATEPASSVQTYVIGYGGAFTGTEPTKLNWIAWGGSGLGQGITGQPAVNWNTDSDTALSDARAQCTTCTDAMVAPDASTLATQLQSIIDQGASAGDFNAQQSITESVFEYVDLVSGKDARMPSERYGAIVPTRFVSSFSLPGFNGQLRAYQNDGSGAAVQRWSAGDKLVLPISTAMANCNPSAVAGGLANECVLPQLHGGATDDTIATSNARIKRRIYTTSRNGVYTFDPDTLRAGTSAERVTLWPPASGLLPTDYLTSGTFDLAMGLPPDTPTSFPPTPTDDPLCDAAAPDTPKKSFDQCWLDRLQDDFKACLGSNLPTECQTASGVHAQMLASRREARDIIFAFMAGAAPVPQAAGLKRTNAAFGGAAAKALLFKARSWVLADSELATAAVVTPPSLSEPNATPYVPEYILMRDGVRNASSKNPDTSGTEIPKGLGLSRPDDDQTVAKGVPDVRTGLKPVMTVIYAPANDMLHAFRAGPNCSPAFSSYTPVPVPNASCAESGGEELWGFVPYDQLEALRLRAANEPQGRKNHVFMLARGIRFGDVFVPGTWSESISGVTVGGQGVWRRILYFGRGIGGKYLTALDVTAPGAYTAKALETVPPIPLWNRGNPDTQNGRSGGLPNHSGDESAYATMGETWSVPTLAYVNPTKANAAYRTTRRSDGVDFVLFVGSGYGATSPVREGTSHYTLDALSGDVIARVDVEDVASAVGIARPSIAPPYYPNALVANSVSYNRSSFVSLFNKAFNVNPHPWDKVSVRVYFGDLHGRLWKMVTDRPDVVVPAADLGADQPIGTAVALLAEAGGDEATAAPNIFLSSGADKRAAGPFRNFAFRDEGTDTSTSTLGTVADDGVTTFTPVVKLFARTFDQGSPEAACGYPTEAVFRGTIQPTSALECSGALSGSECKPPNVLLERVFFGGTRLSLPNTKFAPPTPLSCGTGSYPCRSQFDSVLYALGVVSGQAAYDLNSTGDDAYRIFRDSRIAAISFQGDPDPNRGGSSFTADEGLMKGTPKPPPPAGIPPTATSATANVVMKREPGYPAPAVRYGSAVCQQ